MGIGSGQDEQKRAALEAMARAGQAGVAAYQAGQAEVGSIQKEALASAARTAATINTGGTAAAELAGIVSQPTGLAGQYLVAGQDRFARDIARQSSANSAYFDQAQAAVPAIQADANRQIGLQRAKWQRAASKEAEQMAQWEIKAAATGQAEMQRQADTSAAEQMRKSLLTERDSLAKMEVDAERAAAPQKVAAGPKIMGAQPQRLAPPDPAAVKRLNEIRSRRAAIDAEVARLTGGPSQPGKIASTFGRGGNRLMGAIGRGMDARASTSNARSLRTQPADAALPPTHEYQRRAAEGFGVPPAMAVGMFGPPTPSQELTRITAEQSLNNMATIGAKTPQAAITQARSADPATFALASKAGINPNEVETIRTSNAYKQIKRMVEGAIAAGDSLDDAKFTLNATFRKSPKAIALALAEYGPRFVSSSYIPES